MEDKQNRLLGLCLAPFLFCLCDASITLYGQSSAYWSGHYADVREASPAIHHLLRHGPPWFVGGMLIWIVVFVGLLLLLPDPLALIVSIAVTFGHTVGTATWLLFRFQYGYQVCNAVFLLSAVALGLCLHYGWHSRAVRPYQPPIRNAAVRRLVSALLFGIGAGLFLWPWSV